MDGVYMYRGEKTALARSPEQVDNHGRFNDHLIAPQLHVHSLLCFLILELDPMDISLWPAGTMPGCVLLPLFRGWRKILTKEGLQRADRD